MNPAILTFDYAGFIANPQFALYSNPSIYPEPLLQAFWNVAINYMSDTGNFGDIQGTQRQEALNLMLAHLVYINNLTQAGTVPYLMQTATIDKVTVGLTPPPLKNQFQWWLSVSPYGQQLLAMLQANSVGGHYIGGSSPRAGLQFGGCWPWLA